MSEPFLTRFLQPLLGGRRAECFQLMSHAIDEGMPADALLCDVVWPAMSQVQRLYDDDRINVAVEHMASRIVRAVANQLQPHLRSKPACGRRVLVTSADTTSDELGGQILADLFQAEGWEVFFLGGGVPDDEVLASVGQLRPHVLLIYGALPEAVANTRAMIERIRDVGVCPDMNVVLSGGIFNRADGLWVELGADAFAPTPREVLALATQLGPRTPRGPSLGIVKKRRRKRRAQAVGTA